VIPLNDSTLHFLCESCGYRLDGISADLPCPECGKAIAESLPSRRLGTPWQVRPGVVGWCRTFWTVVWRPRSMWRLARIETHLSVRLLAINLVLATVLTAMALIGGPAFQTPSVGYIGPFVILTLMLLFTLSSIEFTGIRFLGARHRYRITARVALVIVAHASYAWVLGGIGIAIGARCIQVFPLFFDRLNHMTGSGVPFGVMILMVVGVPFVAGMAYFSLLSGVGFHSMRYANPDGPARVDAG